MSLHERAILVTLSLSAFAPRKVDRRVTNTVLHQHGAGHDAGRWVKNLLPETALKPIAELDGEIRRFHASRTLPWTDDGRRILPTAAFVDYMAQMRAYRAAREERVRTFLGNYTLHLAEARRILNGTFNPADYPDPGRVHRRFGFRLDSTPVPDAQDFRVSLHDTDLDELRGSVQSQVERAEQIARNDLLLRIAEPLTNMVNRLSDREAVFRDSLIENLKEIAAVIPALNITGDPRIESLRVSITSELIRFSPDALRADPTLRAGTAAKAQAILDKMSDWLPSES